MKKIRFFIIFLFLVISFLTFPVYGQTEQDLIIKTTDGYIIPLYLSKVSGLDLPIKNYYVDNVNNIGMTWEVNMKGLELPDTIKPSPKIEIKDKDNKVEEDFINGTVGKPIIFTVETDPGALPICEYPAPLGSNNTFNRTYNTPGTYLAVFRAVKDQVYSLRIIKLIISDPGKTYSLTTKVEPSGGGTIDINPPGGTYSEGTKVTLKANANSGYTFTEWSGDITGTQNPYEITVDKDYNITANFQSQGTGPYSEKVRMAQPVNQWDGKGDYVVLNFGISKYQTKYFLIDPKKFGFSWKSQLISFGVRDRYQSKYINIYYPYVYKLNANDELIRKYTLSGSGDFNGIISGFTKEEYDLGVKFLLEISEKGMGSQNDGLTVQWHFN